MTLLKSAELAELKKLASANLESALMAAARLGATRSGTAANPIKRAAAILEYDAEMLKQFDLSSEEHKQDYAERKRIAKALRDLLTNEETGK